MSHLRPFFAPAERSRSLIGGQLDAWTLREADETSDADVGCLAGLMLLLHLCNPALYTVDIAAAACAALAALLADGHSAHPHLPSAAVRRFAAGVTHVHSYALIAAMQHDGVTAKVVQLRPDAIALLAAGAFHASNKAERMPPPVVRENLMLFEALQASAVQVSLWS